MKKVSVAFNLTLTGEETKRNHKSIRELVKDCLSDADILVTSIEVNNIEQKNPCAIPKVVKKKK